MKKVLSALLAVLMTVPLLAACGESSSSKYPNGEINVLNWGEYIADGSEDILTQFEEEFGIKINYKVCPDNETLYTYLKQGDSYDVIIPSDYMLSRLIEEDMLEKLADYYDEEVEMATQTVLAALEPMIILVLAGIVVVLIGAVMAPMLAMYNNMDNL